MMTSRRQIFGGVIAASALSALEAFGEETPATAGDPGELKLGVASYSFREFSRKIAIQGTKKLNTPYINYKDVHLPLTSTPAEIKKAIADTEKAGLKIVGFSLSSTMASSATRDPFPVSVSVISGWSFLKPTAAASIHSFFSVP